MYIENVIRDNRENRGKGGINFVEKDNEEEADTVNVIHCTIDT